MVKYKCFFQIVVNFSWNNAEIYGEKTFKVI